MSSRCPRATSDELHRELSEDTSVELVNVGGQQRTLRRTEGTATVTDVAAAASPRSLLKRSGTLRPSLTKPAPAQVGCLLGHAHGRQVWASVEDSLLVLSPPRSGKGLHLVVNAVLDAPGPVVTTSTRPDTLAVTMAARAKGRAVPGPRGSPPGPGSARAAPRMAVFGRGRPAPCSRASCMLPPSTDGPRGTCTCGPSPPPRPATPCPSSPRIPTSRPDGRRPSRVSCTLTLARATRSGLGFSQSLTCLSDPVVLDCVTPSPAELFDPVSLPATARRRGDRQSP